MREDIKRFQGRAQRALHNAIQRGERRPVLVKDPTREARFAVFLLTAPGVAIGFVDRVECGAWVFHPINRPGASCVHKNRAVAIREGNRLNEKGAVAL